MRGTEARCACGSGLRAVRCCQLDTANLPPPGSARPLAPVIERARQALQQNGADEAHQLCLNILELAPGQLDALTMLHRICKQKELSAAAEALLRRIVTLHPNTFWAVNDLALLTLGKGAIFEAETHARNAIRLAPENAQSHYLMGLVMTESNRPKVGEYHYQKVLELTGRRDRDVIVNLAWNLKNQGRMTESRELYAEATAGDDGRLHGLLGWARMEEADRNLDAAEDLLTRAEALAPDNPSILLSRAVVKSRKRAYDDALTLLGRVEELSGDKGLGANEWLEKGRLLDQMGRYDEAWAAFTEGKKRCREVGGLFYRTEMARQLIERLTAFFTEGRMRLLPRGAARGDVAQPIFIVGFPRSGTTLVEQTLSAHPRISAGDELPFINELTDAMVRTLNSPLGYPEALAELWMGDRRHGIDELRDYYLERVRRLGIVEPGAVWFTDKMPLNETHLGLITLLFPQSPILHVIRHPLDVVLSVFSNHLTHGFQCAFALETAALHFRRIAELVEHYRGVLTMRYLPVRYEEMVDDQEASVRRVLDFIGEPFDPACLSFHENRRYARTASYAQVTEPLYDRSRYRYRHYVDHMKPAIDILEPVIARLGYGI
jgi:tetratricopeptide (TPR) repeat protein